MNINDKEKIIKPRTLNEMTKQEIEDNISLMRKDLFELEFKCVMTVDVKEIVVLKDRISYLQAMIQHFIWYIEEHNK